MNAPLRLRPPLATAGFSLVEVMLVIVLIGILAAFLMPNYQVYVERNRGTTAINRLTADIAFTRMQAVRSGEDTRLRILDGGDGYVVERADDEDWVELRRVRTEDLLRGVSFSSGTFRFDQRGLRQADEGDSESIQIFLGDRTYGVQVSLAGRVVVND